MAKNEKDPGKEKKAKSTPVAQQKQKKTSTGKDSAPGQTKAGTGKEFAPGQTKEGTGKESAPGQTKRTEPSAQQRSVNMTSRWNKPAPVVRKKSTTKWVVIGIFVAFLGILFITSLF